MEAHRQNAALDDLIELVHHRWNVPVLAELHRQSGAKFVTLVNRLGVGRGPLSASLEHLIEIGLVRRNTRHGHPMRPEYLLTGAGLGVGDRCEALTRALQRNEETDLAFRKWTLPLVVTIGEERRRFSELRVALAGATPRAITLGLKSLLSQSWVSRSLIDAYPPAAGYELLPRGLRILTRVDGLCRAV